jgi:hypothetical protein
MGVMKTSRDTTKRLTEGHYKSKYPGYTEKGGTRKLLFTIHFMGYYLINMEPNDKRFKNM